MKIYFFGKLVFLFLQQEIQKADIKPALKRMQALYLPAYAISVTKIMIIESKKK